MSSGSAVSRIPEIVDQTAAIAGLVPGVLRTFGCGSGNVADPFRPGEKIAAAWANPIEPFTHVSEMPDLGSLPLGAMIGTHIVTWKIGMKLFVDRADVAEVRRIVAPLWVGYLTAFAAHLTLNQTAQRIASIDFSIKSSDEWAWMAMDLVVTERLTLATAA